MERPSEDWDAGYFHGRFAALEGGEADISNESKEYQQGFEQGYAEVMQNEYS